jgi:uncharacterized protein
MKPETRRRTLDVDRALGAYTAWATRHPRWVLAFGLLVFVCSWALASRLKIKGDFVSLLPTESGSAQRFTQALARKGGSASTLVVLVDSPEPEANRRFIDALAANLETLPKALVESVQVGSRAERRFFQDNRWLFASERDLMIVSCALARERESKLIGFDLDDPCETEVDDELKRLGVDGATSALLDPPAKAKAKAPSDESSSAFTKIREQIERAAPPDPFPNGYFSNPEGTRYALVVRSRAAGMGELSSDELLKRVQLAVDALEPRTFQPAAQVGFAGDVPNAVAERQSLIEDIAIVSCLAVALILATILGYFRSPLSLVYIGVATATGSGIAFAVAALAFGHLNMATGFLGSIIVGNGINTPIVYVASYRERRSQGESVERALLGAALACRRGTWLGALAASGAYAALGVTSFRGFSEFGLIGGVGMLACWCGAFGLCPAIIMLVEGRGSQLSARPSKPFNPWLMQRISQISLGYPAAVLLVFFGLALAAILPVRQYLASPWEYDFSKLRSASSSRSGAAHWSSRADEIFKTRGSPELLLAPDESEALTVADAVVARDKQLFGGKLVERVTTVFDYLGGRPDSVTRKLAVLAEIRDELDRALPRLQGPDREFAEAWRPPERLRPLTPEDLPPLLRERFTESNGRFGTPVYVQIDSQLSRSRGESLLRIAALLEGVRGKDGQIVPNASRATVFAEMIRSMTRDAPRAIGVALLVVVLACALATHAWLPLCAVLGSLLLGVWLTVGVAAIADVRLNFLNFVALPLTFGIGVEYAINLYDRVRALGGDIAGGLRSVGGAVAVCSLTTILGYGSLLVGDNLALRSFGKYAVFGELSCLATALLVMPAGLVLWRRRRCRRRAQR